MSHRIGPALALAAIAASAALVLIARRKWPGYSLTRIVGYIQVLSRGWVWRNGGRIYRRMRGRIRKRFTSRAPRRP